MPADPYCAFVGFYDEWSAGMEGDVEFYTRRALEADGPVVELGVGTGRVAIPIARAGRDVIGVDVSPAMLREGAVRALEAGVADRITWVEGAMQDFTSEPPVNLVIIPFRSFLHLTTSDDQLRTLANVRASLVPGGLLALNMFVPDPALIAAREGRRVLQSEFTDEVGRRCELWSVPSYEAATQRLRVRAIREAYQGEAVTDVAEAVLDLRLVYPGEMEHLLARAGFEVEARYGWFDERPFGPGSEEMIWVARRP